MCVVVVAAAVMLHLSTQSIILRAVVHIGYAMESV